MSNSQDAGFGKFVPGFDFLQNLAKGASETIPQMPNLTSWIAPTLNVEELDKRISELKTVHFWLEQNSKALGATVQALEVQKMTLATLKGMNFNIGEMANALKLNAADAADAVFSGVKKGTEKATTTSKTIAELAAEAEVAAQKASQAAQPVAAKPAGLVDPIQLWGALTQQFQEIAASAMKDASKSAASQAGKKTVASAVKASVNATKKVATSAGRTVATAKKVAKKTLARKT